MHMTARSPVVAPMAVSHLKLPVTTPFHEFQISYEQAVPVLDMEKMTDLVTRGAPWPEMTEVIEAAAPFGFLVYFKLDVDPLMGLAGHPAPCTAYLMGNHIIAEKMLRHDPQAMLYAPLRTLLWVDDAGDTWFTVDQPSSQFASLGDPAITTVGHELDSKLAVLLEHLQVEIPPSLKTPVSTVGSA
jgi:Domain of unknown function DUF302